MKLGGKGKRIRLTKSSNTPHPCPLLARRGGKGENFFDYYEIDICNKQ